MEFILILIFLNVGIFGFNWLMGYCNQNITLDLDERYLNLNDYAKAVKAELESQGKTVDYRGNRLFIIKGKQYHLIERNVSMGGVPLQHTLQKI
ncbi:hypothetical protein [Bacillus sp. AFS096315]|uniref:hypothetical protein n=1 Tax=Bacillus sp. AFS096315 TaxID=2033517 RepID=UPI000BEE0B5B|nr:hypothetical protein [Bacillus sp. AFS096315]PEC47175.1 hypothetical protein CON00_22410 [Bacillus sp. AFS096315]